MKKLRRAVSAALLMLAVSVPASARTTGDVAGPRLIVTVVVDQFSANLFNQ